MKTPGTISLWRDEEYTATKKKLLDQKIGSNFHIIGQKAAVKSKQYPSGIRGTARTVNMDILLTQNDLARPFFFDKLTAFAMRPCRMLEWPRYAHFVRIWSCLYEEVRTYFKEKHGG